MTKQTMIKKYRTYSKADSYIVGFVYNSYLYMVGIEEIPPRFLKIEQASRNQGDNLRLRISKKYKSQLAKKAEVLGSCDMLNIDRYNKGEAFEKIVSEKYGIEWKKDNVPFYIAGDIEICGKQVQIKLDSATLTNSKQLEKIIKNIGF